MFSHNPRSSSIPRNFCHHNERSGGRGSRRFPFLLPPFKKGNVFRVKVTSLNPPGVGRIGSSLPKHATPLTPAPPHPARLGQRMEVIFKRAQLSGPRGIPIVGREGQVDSFGMRCIPRMILWSARSEKLRDNKYSEET